MKQQECIDCGGEFFRLCEECGLCFDCCTCGNDDEKIDPRDLAA